MYKEQLEFYRCKNGELEERVESLIRVNRELKDAVERAIGNKNNSVKEYYEAEVLRLQKEVSQLKGQPTKEC
jgi:hypothetical protein